MDAKNFLLVLLFSSFELMTLGREGSFYDFLNRSLMQSTELKKDDDHELVEAVKDNKKSKLKVSYHSLKNVEQKLVFVQLLRAQYPSAKFSSVIEADDLEALDIINKDSNKVSLISRISPKTIFGDITLTRMVARPLIDTKEIYARQAFIKETLQDELLDGQMKKALENISAGQEKFFSFFDKKNEISKELESRIYFREGLNWLNKDNVALYGSRTLKTFMYCLLALPVEFYSSFLATALFEGFKGETRLQAIARILTIAPIRALGHSLVVIKNRHIPFESKHSENVVLPYMREGLNRENVKLIEENYNRELAKTTGDMYRQQKLIFPDSKIKPVLLTALPVIFGDLLNAYKWHTLNQKIRLERSLILNMHERLINVAKLVNGLHEINLLAQKQPKLREIVPNFQYIENLFDKKQGGKAQRLVSLLQTRTFLGSPSYFFSQTVRILIAYKLMEECKEEFVQALEAVGEFDALHSVAQLFKYNKKGKYCFVKLLESEKPIIKFDRMWNPLMDAGEVVTNDISLGIDGDRNMMITGPNGSGKSTNMKAIALNILLGQTFGVAAAERASLTPFDHINTYLNVQENIKERLSTFMAEIYRLEEICNRIKSLPAGKRSFTIIDEGLRGTVAEEGVSRLCKMMREMISSDQSIVILATHFELPTRLEKDTGRVANYYVTIEEPKVGQFIRTYQMKRGINEWWFSDKIKRQRFIDWLIKIGRK